MTKKCCIPWQILIYHGFRYNILHIQLFLSRQHCITVIKPFQISIRLLSPFSCAKIFDLVHPWYGQLWSVWQRYGGASVPSLTQPPCMQPGLSGHIMAAPFCSPPLPPAATMMQHAAVWLQQKTGEFFLPKFSYIFHEYCHRKIMLNIW